MIVSSGISSLGYVVIESTDTSAWFAFGENVLGLRASSIRASAGIVGLRMDDRPSRFIIVPGNADRFFAAGWELPCAESWSAAINRLEKAGHQCQVLTDAEAALRSVFAVARCTDPAGNIVELFHGRIYDYEQFISPVGVPRFVTGEQGLGHIVLPAPDLPASFHFYTNLLGFGVTDEMRFYWQGGRDDKGTGLWFLHCDNARHHSLALYGAAIAAGAVHLMVEVENIDEIGRAVDRCKRHKASITTPLGRHTNDRMMSFYIKSPAGFDIEYGCDGWTCPDWSKYIPTKSLAPSLWGHGWQAPMSNPEADAEAASAIQTR